MSSDRPHRDRAALERYLRALYQCAPTAAWVEVRVRRATRMQQSFHPAGKLDVVAGTILARSAVSDVFVGVVPRARRSGGRTDLIADWNVVWADCDDAGSVLALERLRPAPSMVVASSDEHRHAYWFLGEPLALERIESINRRLAAALGADRRSADAARILRPVGALNRKHSPPASVRLLALEEHRRYSLAELESDLPRQFSTPLRVSGRARQEALLADPLRRIPPRVYVERLTNERVDSFGKIHCPFHQDRTASLHVYSDPERGWTCFGCRTQGGRPLGGDIYTLASLLWRIPPRGSDFLTLRTRLDRVFGVRRV
ncbi:MAG TPA: DNA-primase RepB domain-containing protein [Solirubrobacteraceae bacterium]|jgi:hypothetical protein|nr:DNA-primase RepB domain-containing protein [Solirubrobacteraceae bacterium]